MSIVETTRVNLGKRGKSNVKELLEMWYASGTDMLSVTKSPEKSMNRSISLSVDSELVKQDPDALLLLTILSLLSAGTMKQNFCWWATSIKMIPSAIATLSDAGLLVEDEWENSTSPVLSVVPVIQSFMQQQDRVAEEIRKQTHLSCCEYILAHACCFDDPTFPKNSKALAAEDANIQSILFGSPLSQPTVLSDRTIDALVAFSWHRCDTKPALDIANHAVTVARASGLEDHIASAVWCLGKTYAKLGNHHSVRVRIPFSIPYSLFVHMFPIGLRPAYLSQYLPFCPSLCTWFIHSSHPFFPFSLLSESSLSPLLTLGVK